MSLNQHRTRVGKCPPTIRSRLSQLGSAVLLLAALYQGQQNGHSYQLLHQSSDTRDYTQSILAQAPPNAVILAHWHWATPLWYLQTVEQQRPDVSIQFVFPTVEEYPATWARRTAETLAAGHNVITTHYDPSFYTNLPTPEPLAEAFLFRQTPLSQLPTNMTPAAIYLGETIHIKGYTLSSSRVSIGQELRLTVAWQPLQDTPYPGDHTLCPPCWF